MYHPILVKYRFVSPRPTRIYPHLSSYCIFRESKERESSSIPIKMGFAFINGTDSHSCNLGSSNLLWMRFVIISYVITIHSADRWLVQTPLSLHVDSSIQRSCADWVRQWWDVAYLRTKNKRAEVNDSTM